MAFSYKIKELEEYSAYVGRLKIKLEVRGRSKIAKIRETYRQNGSVRDSKETVFRRGFPWLRKHKP